MKAYLGILIVALSIPANRDLSKKDIRGTYEHSNGEPGRTIVEPDGSELHLPPITYSRTRLELKRWGRCEEYSSGMEIPKGLSPLKGRWELKGDSVYLKFGERSEAYYVQENGNLLHSNGACVLYREYEPEN